MKNPEELNPLLNDKISFKETEEDRKDRENFARKQISRLRSVGLYDLANSISKFEGIE